MALLILAISLGAVVAQHQKLGYPMIAFGVPPHYSQPQYLYGLQLGDWWITFAEMYTYTVWIPAVWMAVELVCLGMRFLRKSHAKTATNTPRQMACNSTIPPPPA